MTVISAVVADAFREGNILAVGKTPTPAQATEALNLLDQLFATVYGSDAGEKLIDWPLGNFGLPADMSPLPYAPARLAHPPLNSRLVALNEAPMTVELPPEPQDGTRYAIVDPNGRLAAVPVTISAVGRTIEGAPSVVVNAIGPDAEIVWIYLSDTGNWARVVGVTAASPMPFPKRWDRMFTLLLAMRLAPRYGRQLDGSSAAFLKRDQRDFVNRYLQSAPLERNGDISYPFMSIQSFNSGRAFSSTRAFGAGRPY